MTPPAALGTLDTPKVAGLLALGAVAVLVLLRRGFGGVAVHLGD